jgi:hypothetical protein
LQAATADGCLTSAIIAGSVSRIVERGHRLSSERLLSFTVYPPFESNPGMGGKFEFFLNYFKMGLGL